MAGEDAGHLGALVARELLARAALDPARLDEVIAGCVGPPHDQANVARVLALRAGVPRHVPARTVARNCASGIEAVTSAATAIEAAGRRGFLERIPVRKSEEVVLLPVRQIASIVAEGELLHLTTIGNERYTIAYRLHVLEARLDPRRFVRLGRGTLAAVDLIQRFSPMPGGTYQVTLSNGQQLQASRIQSKLLRETLLRL